MESSPVATLEAEIARLRARLEGLGVNPDSAPPRRLPPRERRHEVLEAWRLTGASDRAIGARFGISHTQVQKDLAAALDEEVKNQGVTTQREKAWMRANIIRLQGTYMGAALRGDVGAGRTIKLLYDRLARLDGLDAPIRVDRMGEVSEIARDLNMSESELSEILAQLIADDRDTGRARRRSLRAI